MWQKHKLDLSPAAQVLTKLQINLCSIKCQGVNFMAFEPDLIKSETQQCIVSI